MKNNPYARHRFPAEIISHCVWLYNSFSLSLGDIEKMMLYRGVEVSYESIRDWVDKFIDALAILRRFLTWFNHGVAIDQSYG